MSGKTASYVLIAGGVIILALMVYSLKFIIGMLVGAGAMLYIFWTPIKNHVTGSDQPKES